MADTVDGYTVAYTHRGSWTASRSYKGRMIDNVPVAWDRDYSPGKPPTLVVWFKKLEEAKCRLQSGSDFIVALAKKREQSASSHDIYRLFQVSPIELVEHETEVTRGGLRCYVKAKCPPPEGV